MGRGLVGHECGEMSWFWPEKEEKEGVQARLRRPWPWLNRKVEGDNKDLVDFNWATSSPL